MRVRDIMDYGQGDDRAILDVICGFDMFRSGFYSLIKYSDWWEVFNQDVIKTEVMKKAWNRIDIDKLHNAILELEAVIAGSYIRFDKFAAALVKEEEEWKSSLPESF